ncbi:uncharacterized protein LOC129894683 [Solanum dulcamara]|uniref:uncharacterized protein LOC129894683 n=1 Tax=Solanum dulcamara TaxID=45834 RepID=UPI0024855DEF|nr:uncharacterized protein LOC129894683 [Solanum dulcamara]
MTSKEDNGWQTQRRKQNKGTTNVQQHQDIRTTGALLKGKYVPVQQVNADPGKNATPTTTSNVHVDLVMQDQPTNQGAGDTNNQRNSIVKSSSVLLKGPMLQGTQPENAKGNGTAQDSTLPTPKGSMAKDLGSLSSTSAKYSTSKSNKLSKKRRNVIKKKIDGKNHTERVPKFCHSMTMQQTHQPCQQFVIDNDQVGMDITTLQAPIQSAGVNTETHTNVAKANYTLNTEVNEYVVCVSENEEDSDYQPMTDYEDENAVSEQLIKAFSPSRDKVYEDEVQQVAKSKGFSDEYRVTHSEDEEDHDHWKEAQQEDQLEAFRSTVTALLQRESQQDKEENDPPSKSKQTKKKTKKSIISSSDKVVLNSNINTRSKAHKP